MGWGPNPGLHVVKDGLRHHPRRRVPGFVSLGEQDGLDIPRIRRLHELHVDHHHPSVFD